jgi:hypothetical protein
VRKLLAIVGLLLVAATAQADYFASGYKASGYYASGYFEVDAGGGQVAVPNVVGEADSAAADAILEGEGLDLGGVTARCSAEAEDEVVGQSPGPGVLVDLGALVDVLVSNGIECVNSGGTGVRLRGLRMRGL